MTVDTVIAILALLISAYAVFTAKKANDVQANLTDREVELVRHQLEKIRQDARAEQNANVSARLYKVAKSSWRLKIFNTGPAIAKNVCIELISPDQSSIMQDDISRKLPIKRMEKGEYVEISTAVHMGSKAKEEIEVFWDDAESNRKSKRIELTL